MVSQDEFPKKSKSSKLLIQRSLPLQKSDSAKNVAQR